MRRTVAAYEDDSLLRKLASWAPQCDRAESMSDAELIDAARDGMVVTGALTIAEVEQAILVVHDGKSRCALGTLG